MYTQDAIKDVPPELTVNRCEQVFEKYKFIENDIIKFSIFKERYNDFGVYTGTLFAQPLKLYTYFPQDFFYLEDRAAYPFEHGSNGKGLSLSQCKASLFMEFFERISIRFKVFELKYNSKCNSDYEGLKKVHYTDYIKSLGKESSTLYQHINHSNFYKHIFDIDKDYVDIVKIKDIISNNSVLFPLDVLLIGSNGYTSGNTEKESIIGGIFEIVERFSQTQFCYDRIEAHRLSIDSVIHAYPELKTTINKCQHYFDKFDVVNINFTLRDVKFYSIIIRSQKNIYNFNNYFSGGVHLSQRIALIRALSECVQAFGKLSNRHLSGADRFFSNYFIQLLAYKIQALPEVKIENDNITFKSIDSIYNNTLKAFESVYVHECTNNAFKFPAHIVYIPELFSQTYYWSDHFNYSNFKINDLIVAQNIEGLQYLFFKIAEVKNKEKERAVLYLFLLIMLGDKELLDYHTLHNTNNLLSSNSISEQELKKYFENALIHRWYYKSLIQQFDKYKSIIKNILTGKERIILNYTYLTDLKVPSITPIDSEDNESFYFFNTILNKNDKTYEDYLYLFEVYARIGCLDYGLYYCRKHKTDFYNKTEFFLNQYSILLNRLKQCELIERSKSVESKINYVKKELLN